MRAVNYQCPPHCSKRSNNTLSVLFSYYVYIYKYSFSYVSFEKKKKDKDKELKRHASLYLTHTEADVSVM